MGKKLLFFKKRILGIICSILMLFSVLGIPLVSHAEEPVTVSNLDEFVYAVNSDNPGVIKLGANITLTDQVYIIKDMTLDLNGHTLDTSSNSILIYSNLVIKDSSTEKKGKITGSSAFKLIVGINQGSNQIKGNLTIESGNIEATKLYSIRVLNGLLTINGGTVSADSFTIYDDKNGEVIINGGTVSAKAGPAIQVKKTLTVNDGKIYVETPSSATAISLYGDCSATINGGTIEAISETNPTIATAITAYKNTELTVNRGTITSSGVAIRGNGSADGSNEGTNAKFNINGGNITSTNDTAIYAPQVRGETTITGGNITGACSGIEIRSGTLNISGGTITGNKTEYSKITRDNFSKTTTGSAVSIHQNTTKQPITVNISGGELYGYLPVSESNPLANPLEDIAKINYSITGGSFYSSGDKTVSIEDLQNGKFISGGIFTHNVTDYVEDGYAEKIEKKMIAVHKLRTAKLYCGENGTATLTNYKTTSDDGTNIAYEESEKSDTYVDTLYNNKIAVNCVPDTGYEIDGIVAKDSEGSEIPVTITGNEGILYMPDQDATVSVTYKPISASKAKVVGPEDITSTYGDTDTQITISATPDDGNKISGYQWYSCDDKKGTNPKTLTGETKESISIPSDTKPGTYYYYCVVTTTRSDNNQTAETISDVASATVKKAKSSLTKAPKAIEGLVYNEKKQSLITEGTAEGGTLMYALGDKNGATQEFSTVIPDGVDAGTYYVWYKIEESDNYLGTDPVNIENSISKKPEDISDKDPVSPEDTETPDITEPEDTAPEAEDTPDDKKEENRREEDSSKETSNETTPSVTTPSYSSEWVNGLWYSEDGTQTYKYKGSWKEGDGGRWFGDESGWFPTNSWQKIDGDWYFFDSEGLMAMDQYCGAWGKLTRGAWYVGKDGKWDGSPTAYWHLSGKKWWFGDSSGWYAKSRWLQIKGDWYYFGADGFAVTDGYVDGYYLDSDGKCVTQ